MRIPSIAALAVAALVSVGCKPKSTFIVLTDKPVDVDVKDAGGQVVVHALALADKGTFDVPQGDVTVVARSAAGSRTVTVHVVNGADRVLPGPGVCAVSYDLTDSYVEKHRATWEANLPSVRAISKDGSPVPGDAIHVAWSVAELPDEIPTGGTATVTLIERIPCDADSHALNADLLERLKKRFPG